MATFVKKARFAICMILLGFGLALLAVWYAGTHTLIRTKSDTFWAPSADVGFDEWYVDTRDWGPLEYLENRGITRILIDRGYEDALESAQKTQQEFRDNLDRELKGLSEKLNRKVEE